MRERLVRGGEGSGGLCQYVYRELRPSRDRIRRDDAGRERSVRDDPVVRGDPAQQDLRDHVPPCRRPADRVHGNSPARDLDGRLRLFHDDAPERRFADRSGTAGRPLGARHRMRYAVLLHGQPYRTRRKPDPDRIHGYLAQLLLPFRLCGQRGPDAHDRGRPHVRGRGDRDYSRAERDLALQQGAVRCPSRTAALPVCLLLRAEVFGTVRRFRNLGRRDRQRGPAERCRPECRRLCPFRLGCPDGRGAHRLVVHRLRAGCR